MATGGRLVHYRDMNSKFLCALAGAALLGGCAAPAYVSPVQVTRFVGQQDAFLAQGTIELVAAPGTRSDSLEYSFYQDAVRRELEQLGYRVVAQNGSQIAQVSVQQTNAAPSERRGPVSVGMGGSTGSYGSGVGLGIGFDLSGPPPERIETTLAVTIRKPEGGQNLWEGRAGMTATTNSDFASDSTAAARIASALFAGFPGNSGETIEVE